TKSKTPLCPQRGQSHQRTRARPGLTRKPTGPQWQPPSKLRFTRLLLLRAEQSELRRIARRLGHAEVAERMRRDEPPARRALQEPALDQIRLDDVLDRVARLRQSGGQRLYAPPAATLIYRHPPPRTPIPRLP